MQRLRRLFCVGNHYGQLIGLTFALIALPLTAVSQTPGNFSAPTAAPALLVHLDGQKPVLQPLLSGSGFTIGQRSIERKAFRHGSGAEKILLRGPAGQVAQLAYLLPPAPVIRELRFHADLLTNRAGVQLAARVVLPRSINPSTGRPFELLVRGGKIGSGGGWEELTLKNLPQQLASHARVARVQHGASIDERGAYVSQVVFLAPGGSGVTELIVDRIQVFGVVRQQPLEPNASSQAANVPSLADIPRLTPPANRAVASRHKKVRVPRIIQWQGEPFEQLKQLGFNTIGMNRRPTIEELQQIRQLGLALYCPPPSPKKLSDEGITEKWDQVLAWNLGEQLSLDDLDHLERWEQLVARHDPIDARPTVLAPQLHSLESSRISDIVLVGRAVVGNKMTIREHTAWLAQRQRLARPGTPLWTKVETQPSPSQRLQMVALSTHEPANQASTYAQLTAITAAAWNIKTRGFYFQSQNLLTAKDATTTQRAMALELTNLRLQLAEPWVAAGKELASARSTHPDLSALVMQTERSHLLVPIWWSLEFDSSVHPRKSGKVSFVVPGVAESSQAFLVTMGGMQRLKHQRVTGGIRVSLEALPLDSFIMFSDDSRAIAQVARYIRSIAPRAAKLRRDLVQSRLQEVASLLGKMPDTDLLQRILLQAQSKLVVCDDYLKAENFQLAYLNADAVDLAMDALESEMQTSVGGAKSSTQATTSHSPLALPDCLQLQRTLARAPVSANLLSNGGFENLSAMLNHGWRHQQLPVDGITTAVRLSPESPHSGSYCLELEARPLDEAAPIAIVPTAPVWISSAPLQVREGDLLEITGVARLSQSLHGSVDGLQIIDSIGGPDMALRIHESPRWQPFRLIRAATSDSQVSVTIALSGLGKAQIDDLAVRVVERRK